MDSARSIDPVQFTQLVDDRLRQLSGSVFYSGRKAFSKPSRLYILGLNPGGKIEEHRQETVQKDLDQFCSGPESHSAYDATDWADGGNRTTFQSRIGHFFNQLELSPTDVPASNVIFVRSPDEASIENKARLMELCWPVHRAVIDQLDVDTVLCLGDTAGLWLRKQLGATKEVDSFAHANGRKVTSTAHVNPANGMCVITAMHPSWFDWSNPKEDPSPLIKRMLALSKQERITLG